MRRHWYTFFLLISLGVFAMRTDGIKVYGKQQKKDDIQTEWETEIQETGKEPESIKEPESVKEPESIRESQTVQYPILESDSLFPDDFQKVLFIGDSRTAGLSEYGQMGEADIFAGSGMTVFNLWDSEIAFRDKGKKTLGQVLTENQYQVIHIMLGINELGYSMEQIVEKYQEAVGEIQIMQPEANVVLGANLHVTEENSTKSTIYNNQRINALNAEIEKIGEELNCHFINVNELFDDVQGNLSKEYSTDGSHILGKYYADWARWILNK